MLELSIRQLRGSLATIEQLVDREGEIVITRHGRPLAKVISLTGTRNVPSHADLRASMPYLEISSEDMIRAERDGVAETKSPRSA